MKFFWRIFLPLFILALGTWYVLDSSSRHNFSFQCPNPEDVRIFNRDTTSDVRLHYQKFFGQDRFRFPRNSVSKILVRRNVPFISFMTERQLSKKSQDDLLAFLNNPDNFSWEQNVMLHSQADYLLYFYGDNQRLNGKLWLCSSCFMLKAVPFSPNMKFGHVKKDKWTVLESILGINYSSSS